VKHSYQYDALDRIEKETVEPEPTPFTVPIALMTYDADDRLDTFNGQTCLSDLDGNLVTGPLGGNVTGFTFDARNRLTEVGNATFAYDSEGRRVSKTENGTTTTYVHDPQSPLSRLLSATNGNTSTFYVYTPAGMLLFEDTPSTTGIRVPHHDYRGSTIALSNATGAVTGRVVYGTYGESVSRTGITATRFLYHGAYGVETDTNGLCLMRARYYSSESRRFLNADPSGFGGGANWYSIATGQPVQMIDPTGLMFRYTNDTVSHVAIQTSAGVTSGYMSSTELTDRLRRASPGSVEKISITGHGSSQIMGLSDGSFIVAGVSPFGPTLIDERGNDVTQVFKDSLAPDGEVCLRVCGTGAFNNGEASIAEAFAFNLPMSNSVVGYPLISFGIPGTGIFLGIPISFSGQFLPHQSPGLPRSTEVPDKRKP